jgi:hypothetical protein
VKRKAEEELEASDAKQAKPEEAEVEAETVLFVPLGFDHGITRRSGNSESAGTALRQHTAQRQHSDSIVTSHSTVTASTASHKDTHTHTPCLQVPEEATEAAVTEEAAVETEVEAE